MEQIKEPTVSDIMTKDLVCYDDAFHDDCVEFCKKRNIEVLPAFDSNQNYYVYTPKNEFVLVDITPIKKIHPGAKAFSDATLNRFSEEKKTPLLIVFEEEVIQGIVHFCDYNKPPIRTFLNNKITEFEDNLSELLALDKKERAIPFTDINDLVTLTRNPKMDFITMKKPQGNNQEYDFESFQSLVTNYKNLQINLRRIESRLNFLRQKK